MHSLNVLPILSGVTLGRVALGQFGRFHRLSDISASPIYPPTLLFYPPPSLLSALLGFIVFVPVTMIMARIGARAVYKIDKKLLSKIFGTFLIIVAVRSFIEYLSIS